jgi:hypothetical protein
MPVHTAKEAADHIRPHVNASLNHDVDPAVRHAHAFATEVAKHLGLEPVHHVVEHVLDLLEKHEIVPHAGAEYPKWVHPFGSNTKDHTTKVLVHSAEHEDAVRSRPKPKDTVA